MILFRELGTRSLKSSALGALGSGMCGDALPRCKVVRVFERVRGVPCERSHGGASAGRLDVTT